MSTVIQWRESVVSTVFEQELDRVMMLWQARSLSGIWKIQKARLDKLACLVWNNRLSDCHESLVETAIAQIWCYGSVPGSQHCKHSLDRGKLEGNHLSHFNF